jgi:hypothetical protein
VSRKSSGAFERDRLRPSPSWHDGFLREEDSSFWVAWERTLDGRRLLVFVEVLRNGLQEFFRIFGTRGFWDVNFLMSLYIFGSWWFCFRERA